VEAAAHEKSETEAVPGLEADATSTAAAATAQIELSDAAVAAVDKAVTEQKQAFAALKESNATEQQEKQSTADNTLAAQLAEVAELDKQQQELEKTLAERITELSELQLAGTLAAGERDAAKLECDQVVSELVADRARETEEREKQQQRYNQIDERAPSLLFLFLSLPLPLLLLLPLLQSCFHGDMVRAKIAHNLSAAACPHCHTASAARSVADLLILLQAH
jgi:hypothetical protein